MKFSSQLVCSLLVFSALEAMPAMNPLAPSLEPCPLFTFSSVEMKAGFRGDYVYDRALHDGGQPLDRFSLFSNEGVLTFNFAHDTDLFFFAGRSTISSNSLYGANELTMATNPSFIAGFGGTAILFHYNSRRCGRGAFSLTGQYEDTSWTNTNTTLLNQVPSGTVTSLRYREGTVNLGYGHQIGMLSAYFAVTWSRVFVLVRGAQNIGPIELNSNFKSQNTIGAAFGVTLVDTDRMTVTGEARFANEKAATIMADFHF